MTGSPAGHRIRLRGPWTFVWLDEAGLQVGTPARKQHPVDWPEFTRGQSGTVRLTRTFHAPSNLDPDESVSVIVTGVRGHGEVRLNGELLGTFTADQSDCDFPLPLPLPFSNTLGITVSFAPGGGATGDVVLVIRQRNAGV